MLRAFIQRTTAVVSIKTTNSFQITIHANIFLFINMKTSINVKVFESEAVSQM